jgi:hypothetical protein
LAADFDTPNSGASCRNVRLVRQYAATSRTRSASGSLHGRPRLGASAPSLRNWVTNLLKARGLSPVNGAIQDGSAAVITPAIRRSFQLPTPLPKVDPGHRASKGAKMGLMLFPGDDDVASPDVSWSYTGFSMFRKWLAQTEGFALAEMAGFGGDCQWSSVSTTLAPLLNHPDDDGPDLAPAQCAAMLPRLEAILDQRQPDDSDPALRRRIEDVSQLVTVLRFCVDKNVELIFG